jgi:site-specific recombinase XerD
VLFPTSFRGELLQYMQGSLARRAVHLFESNRLRPYSTRRIRQIIHAYALAEGIQKRVYPHLFRHHHTLGQNIYLSPEVILGNARGAAVEPTHVI